MKRSSGVLVIVLLLAALLVALLMLSQADSLGLGGTRRQDTGAQTADPVQQAQQAVNAINDRLREEEEAP